MKKCFHCEKEWSNRKEHPKYCVRCGNNPDKPSLLTRLKIALHEGYGAFRESGVPKGYHERVFKPKQATIDDFISEEQAAAQGYETDPRD